MHRSYMYDKQLEIVEFDKGDARFLFCEAATKIGKTYSALVWLTEKVLKNKDDNLNFFWISPFRSQAKEMFKRFCLGITKANIPPGWWKKNETELIVKFTNRGQVFFRSGDNPEALVGFDCGGAVVDEAAMVKADAWDNLLTTVTQTRGSIICIGNVVGRQNWFYRNCRKWEKENNPRYLYKKFTIKDALEAGLYTHQDIEDIKNNCDSIARFNELYLCIARETGSNPFEIANIEACVMDEDPEDTEVIAWGVDLAKSYDYTAVIGLNKDCQIVYSDRWQGNWKATQKKLISLIGDDHCLVDKTSAGDVVLENIQDDMKNTEGLWFTNKSKGNIIEGLAYKFHDRSIGISRDNVYTELVNYELSFTPTGKIHYEGRNGQHDDYVCALALAVQKYKDVTEYTPLEFVFSSYDEDF